MSAQRSPSTLNRPLYWIALAALLAIAAMAYWWLQNYERVDAEIDLPWSGPASYNPLYALEKTLKNGGLKVTSVSQMRFADLKLSTHDTLVLDGPTQQIGVDDAKALLDWVRAGGHLILALPPAQQLPEASDEDDGDDDSGSASKKTGATPSDEFSEDANPENAQSLTATRWQVQGADSALLQALGVEPVENPACARFEALRRAKKSSQTELPDAQWCPPTRFLIHDESEIEWDWFWGDHGQGFVLGRGSLAQGSLTLAATLKPFYSRQINQPAYRLLARQVFADVLARGQHVVLVYGSNVPSLMVLIVRHAWPVLLPLGLALLLWAWARSARFGPLLTQVTAPRRALSEHIFAAGEFNFRRRRFTPLYDALRSSTLDKLKRKHPLLLGLDALSSVHYLAERSGIGKEKIQSALFNSAPEKPDTFIADVRTLLALRNQP
jgi:hypothetical protein